MSYTIITGSSSGIGAATARLLAEQGHNLLLLARSTDKLSRLRGELLAKFQVEVEIFTVDVTDSQQVDDFVDAIADKSISALINNAGLALGTDKFHEGDLAEFEQMIAVNVTGAVRMARLLIPCLQKTQGHIVNISSIAGREPYGGGSVYCGTKSFVKTLSKCMRIDLCGTGVRVTDIAPGAVETNFSNVRFRGDDERADKYYEDFEPLTPEDIAETIWFALNRPKHVNIESMVVYPTAQASPNHLSRT